MVSKVCFRSHGQPCFGSRNRAMSARSASIVGCGSLIGLSARRVCGALEGQRTDAQAIQRQEHPGRCPPDGVSLERNVPELDLFTAAEEPAALAAEIGRV